MALVQLLELLVVAEGQRLIVIIRGAVVQPLDKRVHLVGELVVVPVVALDLLLSAGRMPSASGVHPCSAAEIAWSGRKDESTPLAGPYSRLGLQWTGRPELNAARCQSVTPPLLPLLSGDPSKKKNPPHRRFSPAPKRRRPVSPGPGGSSEGSTLRGRHADPPLLAAAASAGASPSTAAASSTPPPKPAAGAPQVPLSSSQLCSGSISGARGELIFRVCIKPPGLGNSRLDVEASIDQGTSYLADEQQKGGIWELFSEAQRNILYLHKQRPVSMEELKKLQDENKSLLQEMEILEMERQYAVKNFPVSRK
ncbi:uncharacterized protein LOC125517001 [Triticum urartu]|uniref:uncharacterized protein LOC125517001 n=1 Tax=Triticum urartu TaxID=4572 RepID=UPI00204391AC|nr:uncharacterized protein LOC125517001 [Triticum urartu]